jgi:hypothetical protein
VANPNHAMSEEGKSSRPVTKSGKAFERVNKKINIAELGSFDFGK